MQQRKYAGYILKFLAILLALTLVARGTSGATLARVVLASPVRSEIIDAINASATVFSTDYIEITAPSGLVISEISLSVGQNIEAGDFVASFELEGLEELRIREAASLDAMLFDLERLNRTEDVEIARRNLRRAQEDYATTVAQGEADIAEATEYSPTALRNHERAVEDFYAVAAQGESDIAAAQSALFNAKADDTAIQNAIRNLARAVEDYESTRDQGEADIADARRQQSNTDRTAIENAQRNLQRARDDYETTRQQTQEAIHSAERSLMLAWYSDNMQTINAAFNALEQARNAAAPAMLAAERRVEDAEEALAQAQRNFANITQDERERAEEAVLSAENRATSNLLTASRRVEDTEAALAQAHENFNNNVQSATTALENAINRAADNLQTAERRIEDTTIETFAQNVKARAEENRLQATRRIEDAATALQTAQQNAADTHAQNTIFATTLQLDIAAKQNDILLLDALIYTGGVLYSHYSGTISFVAQAGEATSNSPIIILRDGSGGFEARMQITQQQAERLYAGAESNVTTGGGTLFFMPTVTGIVSSISQPDENNLTSVTIALPEGDWSIGQRVDTQIILHRANYELSVPISALHSDNSGYFVHVVEQRNTIMGLQNIVVRANVSIVASDSEMASLTGAVNRDSQIITGSNKSISVGDRIRVDG
ncbi:MAG: hypothetical protein FWF78_10190 [Defluviitaleaceae bacterium]|nr:hypothetical protein [Defluviitaleaceae bacterium]